MKRLHVALQVTDLQASTRFYAALFGEAPSVQKDGYAKWMLEDPRVNFSIVAHAESGGIEHLGIQAETDQELHQLYDRAEQANALLREEGHTTCCYARSEKSWAKDPEGLEWELFRTYGTSETFYGETETACCDDECCVEADAS